MTILDAWMAKLGQPATGADAVRDPIAQAFQEVLPVLLDCVLGRLPPEAAVEPLQILTRIRSGQDLTPAQAVSFLFELKPLVDAAAHEAIDRLVLAAFDQYVVCREEFYTRRFRELRRRTRVIERLMA